jgi:hypothetical protein
MGCMMSMMGLMRMSGLKLGRLFFRGLGSYVKQLGYMLMEYMLLMECMMSMMMVMNMSLMGMMMGMMISHMWLMEYMRRWLMGYMMNMKGMMRMCGLKLGLISFHDLELSVKEFG